MTNADIPELVEKTRALMLKTLEELSVPDPEEDSDTESESASEAPALLKGKKGPNYRTMDEDVVEASVDDAATVVEPVADKAAKVESLGDAGDAEVVPTAPAAAANPAAPTANSEVAPAADQPAAQVPMTIA